MPTPTFPLGLALADDPQLTMLAVRLFKNAVPGGGFTSLADFVEATYPDYLCSRPEDWHAADVVDEKCVHRRSKLIDFRATTAAPGEGVWGYYVTILDGGVSKLLDWRAFDRFVPMAAANDNVNVRHVVQLYDVGWFAP